MLGKILTRLFALFGMTLTCVACYGTPYEEYHPEYIISGRVVDTEGNAIKGIRVNNGGEFARTGEDGEFSVAGISDHIWFYDEDGEANGGEFEDREVTAPRHQYYVELGDVELKRKQN